jgi:hypothetical protein
MHLDGLPICACLVPISGSWSTEIYASLLLNLEYFAPVDMQSIYTETIIFNAKNTAKWNQATESVTAYIFSLLKLVNMQVSFPASEMYLLNL